MENQIRELMEEIWDKCKVESPMYIYTSLEYCKMIKEQIAHHKKWNEELFSPKGINHIFYK